MTICTGASLPCQAYSPTLRNSAGLLLAAASGHCSDSRRMRCHSGEAGTLKCRSTAKRAHSAGVMICRGTPCLRLLAHDPTAGQRSRALRNGSLARGVVGSMPTPRPHQGPGYRCHTGRASAQPAHTQAQAYAVALTGGGLAAAPGSLTWSRISLGPGLRRRSRRRAHTPPAQDLMASCRQRP